MKLHTLKYTFLSFCALSLVVACSNDDNAPAPPVTVDPGPVDPAPTDPVALDFTGTYAQVDFMGRPGINTVLNGDDAAKTSHNVSIPSEGVMNFQAGFEARLIALHNAYGAVYENNVLGLDVTTLTTVLAADALEVASEGPTVYFDGGADVDSDPTTVADGDEIVLTGRRIGDDVIDHSLILLFGGANGSRFSGQDTDDDGEPNLPRLTSDGVAITASPTNTFPYLGAPE